MNELQFPDNESNINNSITAIPMKTRARQRTPSASAVGSLAFCAIETTILSKSNLNQKNEN